MKRRPWIALRKRVFQRLTSFAENARRAATKLKVLRRAASNWSSKIGASAILALGSGGLISLVSDTLRPLLIVGLLFIAFLGAFGVLQTLLLRPLPSVLRPKSPTWNPEKGWSADLSHIRRPLRVAKALILRGFVLDAVQLIESANVWSQLGTSHLRSVFKVSRDQGQILTALKAMNLIASRTGNPSDVRVKDRIQSEVDVMNGSSAWFAKTDVLTLLSQPESVLHVVGKTILDYQNGYTIRTHELCKAQAAAGLVVTVVGQKGFVDTQGLDKWEELRDGVRYVGFHGPKRNEILLRDWITSSIEDLAAVVDEVKPSVIHAHSDFLNALIARAVSNRFGLPMVYEVRGFWEETLLTNLSQRNAWPSLAAHIDRYGLPESYTLRRGIEKQMRDASDALVTLDASMAEYIQSEGTRGQTLMIAPNAVSERLITEDLLATEEAEELRQELGFGPDSIIVGQASSLVPYEGIDVLLEAMSVLQATDSVPPVGLLVVGDGPARKTWEQKARRLGIRNCVFTGQVSQVNARRYVALMDITVFPRISTPVTEKVHPLKPIEAMGLGCAVVLSSVAPLKDLAEATGSAKVFEAGNSVHLAQVLTGLLENPEERAELGRLGQNWVQENRTWEKNAQTYQGLYKSLTRTPAFKRSKAKEEGKRFDSESWLARRGRNQLAPLETFIRVSAPSNAEEVPPQLYETRRFPPIELDTLDWRQSAIEHRSWGWRLHAWDFMDATLRRLKKTQERALLDWCADFAQSWFDVFRSGDDFGTMAFYDMAIAQRSVRLGYLTSACIESGVVQEAVVSRLLEAVEFHAKLVEDPHRFSGWNNHGLYTGLAGLALARRFPGAPWAANLHTLSHNRVDKVLSQQFASDGGHVEHSFEYHRMILKTVVEAVDDGILSLDSTDFPLTEALEALDWMIRPDGTLEQVGDTPLRQMITSSSENSSLWWRSRLANAPDSSGEATPKVKILPKTGFLFIRDRKPGADESQTGESYLTFSGSFHSRTHKHADDLSITWFDLGREILIDAGRFGYGTQLPAADPKRREFGYYYAEPERQYVESTVAHNTIEVDGTPHDRVRRKAYGAARFDYRKDGGIHYAEATVGHGFLTHRRNLALDPGVSLDIEDCVSANDGQPHVVRQWLNLPGDLQMVRFDTDHVVFRCSDGLLIKIECSSNARLIVPVRNKLQPEIRGVRSRHDGSMEPAWNFAFEERLRTGSIASRISLGFTRGRA